MQDIASPTKLLMCMATFVATFIGTICLGLATFVLVKKLIDWSAYPVGEVSCTVGLFLLGPIQLSFIGILNEYILSTGGRVISKSRVIIGERLNLGPSEGPSSSGGSPAPSWADPSAQERPGGSTS